MGCDLARVTIKAGRASERFLSVFPCPHLHRHYLYFVPASASVFVLLYCKLSTWGTSLARAARFWVVKSEATYCSSCVSICTFVPVSKYFCESVGVEDLGIWRPSPVTRSPGRSECNLRKRVERICLRCTPCTLMLARPNTARCRTHCRLTSLASSIGRGDSFCTPCYSSCQHTRPLHSLYKAHLGHLTHLPHAPLPCTCLDVHTHTYNMSIYICMYMYVHKPTDTPTPTPTPTRTHEPTGQARHIALPASISKPRKQMQSANEVEVLA